MRRLVLLIIAVGLAAALMITLFVLLVPRPGIQFFTLQDSYRLGETVLFRIENDGATPFCLGSFNPWRVEPLISDDWMRVETHDTVNAVVRLKQGDSREWPWIAQSDPDREQNGFPEVVPGEYRLRLGGWPCDSTGGSGVVLFAFFEIGT